MIYLLGLLLLIAVISRKYRNVMTQKKNDYFQRIDAYEYERQKEILRRAKMTAANSYTQHATAGYDYSPLKETA